MTNYTSTPNAELMPCVPPQVSFFGDNSTKLGYGYTESNKVSMTSSLQGRRRGDLAYATACSLTEFPVARAFPNNWWLRSPGNNSNRSANVNGSGQVNANGNNVNNANFLARPDLQVKQPEIERECAQSVLKDKGTVFKPAVAGKNSGVLREHGQEKVGEQFTCKSSLPAVQSGGTAQSATATANRASVESTISSTLSDIVTMDNLMVAYRSAAMGKGDRRDCKLFEANLDENLQQIQQALLDGSYEVPAYNEFTIYEPKERNIQALAFSGRVVQHLICDFYLTPFFEKVFLPQNAACRIGKGTDYARNNLRWFLSNCDGLEYCLKMDIRKYFPSVSHSILYKILDEYALDPQVRKLLDKFIASHSNTPSLREVNEVNDEATQYNSTSGASTPQRRGLPMGNQTSQIFALLYLHQIDKYIVEDLGFDKYTRYMDDMIIIHPSKERLQEARILIESELNVTLDLELNDKTQLFPLKNGIPYLGWKFFRPYNAQTKSGGRIYMKILPGTKKRIKKRLQGLPYRYVHGELDLNQVSGHLRSGLGYLKKGDTYALRANIMQKVVINKRPSNKRLTNKVLANQTPKTKLKENIKGKESLS